MRARALILTSVSLLALFAVAIAHFDTASAAAAPRKAAAGKDVSTNDDFQRSAHADSYTLLANTGAARGENIYFYKCWMCHNKYAKSGPYLKDLFKQENLVNGEPVSAESVTQFIKEGAAGMPSFKTTLSDAQVSDLVAYIKEGKCCAEGEELPKNPWYRAEDHPWPVQATLHGGASGIVKISSGDSPEGIGVQLIAPGGIRTTVYTNVEGKFEFPSMKANPSPSRAQRKSTTSSSTACPNPMRFPPRRKFSPSSAVTNCSSTFPAPLKRNPSSRRIAPPAIPGSRSSATIMTSAVGPPSSTA
jgi:mono/diheme cytochrome c family protein